MFKKILAAAAGLLSMYAVAATAATFVPISAGMEKRVVELSRWSEASIVLFAAFDPDRSVLLRKRNPEDVNRLRGDSSNTAAVYVTEDKTIFRNAEDSPSDELLAVLITHEFAHHVWHHELSGEQKKAWLDHVRRFPCELDAIVEADYPRTAWDVEKCAYRIQDSLPSEMEALKSIVSM